MADPVYLDLDAIETPLARIRLGGKEYVQKAQTLNDWIANTKEIDKLRVAGDLESESSVMIALVCRAFPDLTPDMLREIPLVKLNAVLELANGGGNLGAKAAADQNPPSAPVEAPAPISPQS